MSKVRCIKDTIGFKQGEIYENISWKIYWDWFAFDTEYRLKNNPEYFQEVKEIYGCKCSSIEQYMSIKDYFWNRSYYFEEDCVLSDKWTQTNNTKNTIELWITIITYKEYCKMFWITEVEEESIPRWKVWSPIVHMTRWYDKDFDNDLRYKLVQEVRWDKYWFYYDTQCESAYRDPTPEEQEKFFR